MNRLRDKVAMVTVGAIGIGLATAELFSEEGARVTVGVSSATAISCSNAVPVALRTFPRCASPDTHGYGTCSVVEARWLSVHGSETLAM